MDKYKFTNPKTNEVGISTFPTLYKKDEPFKLEPHVAQAYEDAGKIEKIGAGERAIIHKFTASDKSEVVVFKDDTKESLSARYNKTLLLELAAETKADVTEDNNKSELAEKVLDKLTGE